MGNEESSEIMRSSPTVKRLLNVLYMEEEHESQTNSLVHHQFSSRLAKADKGAVDRSLSPFIPLSIIGRDLWASSCLINPLIALACPTEIINVNGEYRKCQALPVYKDEMIHPIGVNPFYEVEKSKVYLLILEKPYWRVGWAGISFIESAKELYKLELKIVHFPERILNKKEGRMVHVQEIKKFLLPKNAQLDNSFLLETSNDHVGGILCKIVNKKPYVIGLQISEEHMLIFSKDLFKKIISCLKSSVKKYGGEKEVLKEMDIHEFEIETDL